MRRWELAVAAAVAAALGSCDCGKRKAGDTSGGNPAPADAQATIKLRQLDPERRLVDQVPPVVLPRLESVELLAPGKGPRRVYRYQPDADERQLVVTAIVQTRELQAGKWRDRVALPEIRYGLGVRTVPGAPTRAGPPRPAAPDAGFSLLLRGLPAQVGAATPSEAAAPSEAGVRAADDFLARYRAHVERQRATAGMSARGVLGDVVPDTPPPGGAVSHTRQEIQQLLIESVVPLPEQAIGPGARWRVTWLLRRGAAAVKQVATYELVTAAAGRLTLSARIVHTGERQIVRPPELPASATAELVVLFFEARGAVEVDLAAFPPARAELAVELRVHTRVGDRAAAHDYFSETTGTVRLASAAAGDGAPAARP